MAALRKHLLLKSVNEFLHFALTQAKPGHRSVRVTLIIGQHLAVGRNRREQLDDSVVGVTDE
jgi:hypothetical protein